MASQPDDTEYCTVDLKVHLGGICSITEETLKFNYPDIIKTLHDARPEGIQVAVVGGKMVGKFHESLAQINFTIVLSALGMQGKARNKLLIKLGCLSQADFVCNCHTGKALF